MVIQHNGQTVWATGWFVDGHGHRLFLQRGHLVPLCPYSGPASAMWRLVQEVAEKKAS